jgi:hypothetical protein
MDEGYLALDNRVRVVVEGRDLLAIMPAGLGKSRSAATDRLSQHSPICTTI